MPNIWGKWSKKANRLTKIDFWTLSRPRIDLKLNSSCSAGFFTHSWPPNSIFDFFGFWDTPTCRSRFEIPWNFMKIPVFRTLFLRISALEIAKITIFKKKWSSGVYLYPMYPYSIKKVFRKSTSRFLRGWLVKKFEKKWIWRRGFEVKKSMVFGWSKIQIGSDMLVGPEIRKNPFSS